MTADHLDAAVATEGSTTPNFDDVYSAEYRALVRLATSVVGDPAVAEEATQEAFATAWGRWDELDRPGAFLRRTVLNRAIDLARRSVRTRGRDTDLQRLSPVHTPPADVEIWTIVDMLPDNQRFAIALRYLDGLTNREIAEVLERPENTVKSDIHRALRRLHEELTHDAD